VLLAHFLEQGIPKSAIARRQGLIRYTMIRWIKDGRSTAISRGRDPGVGPESQAFQARAVQGKDQSPSAKYPELTAVRLLGDVKADGFSQSRDSVARLRPRSARAGGPLEAEPGHQAHVDFAEFTSRGQAVGAARRSRDSHLLWLRFYEKQVIRTLFAALEETFAFFRGVPREILFDQMASVIIRGLRDQGGKQVENAEFLRFSANWGSGFAPASRTAPRPRARWSDRSGICARRPPRDCRRLQLSRGWES